MKLSSENNIPESNTELLEYVDPNSKFSAH
jgi:hypothetical protein